MNLGVVTLTFKFLSGFISQKVLGIGKCYRVGILVGGCYGVTFVWHLTVDLPHMRHNSFITKLY